LCRDEESVIGGEFPVKFILGAETADISGEIPLIGSKQAKNQGF